MMFLFVRHCSSLLLGIFKFMSGSIHCFYVLIVGFSNVITSQGKRELVALLFILYVVIYLLISFPLLLLEGL